ncbi:helix-turn-helix domain-containing protein [Streptomyces noursei]|uniref:helix-turn-helix domain-containing protein n=1 Tax=Streptomyces noursei TaxID=1971 RepID=UPI00381A7D0D
MDLLTADLGQADQFVSTTLGELSTADPVLRHTVSTFLNVGFNVSHTAEKLFAHRNTIDRRLARARALLPRPLEQDAVSVAAALMLVELRQDREQGRRPLAPDPCRGVQSAPSARETCARNA